MNRRALVSIIALTTTVIIIVFIAIAVLRIGDSEAGASPSGMRLQRMTNSPNYDGAKFVNTLPTNALAKGNFWEMISSHINDRDLRRPPGHLPTVTPNFENSVSDGKLQAVWLGHASVFISIDDVTILTDPVFEAKLSVVVASTERFQHAIVKREELPRIDVVVISHDHYDHLEKSTIEFFTPRGTLFFVPLGVGAHLELWNVPDSQIVELDWWESRLFKSLNIVCTPARHFSGRTLLKFYETLWGSWAIIGMSEQVYFGGDTGYSKHFKEIGDKYGPFEITILPIGAYGKLWPDIHINPEQAVTAHKDLGGKLLLPIHWGTFDVALHPWDEPIEEFVEVALNEQIQFVAPRMGETIQNDSDFEAEFWWRLKADI